MYFLRLIRITNLLIVVVTMYSLGWFLDLCYGKDYFLIVNFDFFLFVLSVVSITAAGNVINDYYDVEIDKINRPEKVIAENKISLKNMLFIYVILNVASLSSAVFLGLKYNFEILILIEAAVIFLLWIYSKKLKKTLLAGNFIVAFLTSLVPVLTAFFYDNFHNGISIEYSYIFHLKNYENFTLYMSYGIGVFAFILNFLREIVKDMEDIKGDKLFESKTLPIAIGIEKTRIVAITILLFITVFFIVALFWLISITEFIHLIPFLFCIFFVIYSLYLFFNSKYYMNRLKLISYSIKASMILGISMILYWGFILHFFTNSIH